MIKKASVKKRQKKMPEKTQAHYITIQASMDTDAWYKASDFAGVLGIDEHNI